MKSKQLLFDLLWLINLFISLVYILAFIPIEMGFNNEFIFSENYEYLRMFLSFFSMAFFIFICYSWYNYDKKFKYIALIVLLNNFYGLFYYFKIRQKAIIGNKL